MMVLVCTYACQEHRDFPGPPRCSAVGVQDANGIAPPQLGYGAVGGGIY